MSEEKNAEGKKGVVIEFDFAVANGAELLYNATAELLAEAEIPFSARIEAEHLAGGNYQGGLDEYFKTVKTKKTAQRAAKDLASAFADALTKAFPAAVTEDFKAFVRKLLGKGLKVVVSTRADLRVASEQLAEFTDDPNFAIYQETSMAYGSVKWDAWRRAASSNRLRSCTALAVPGSGFSVKGALLAGMGSIAVVNPHVAYQDFGGADEVVERLDASCADMAFRILKV